MALANVPHQTGRVNSGDVSIFYRRFGSAGRTPILVMHGANYFDSYDWIGVAGALASDREVIAFDRRGWGESSWSPSKDYSVDANMGDIHAVVAELKWERPIVVGHSASGRLAIASANVRDLRPPGYPECRYTSFLSALSEVSTTLSAFTTIT